MEVKVCGMREPENVQGLIQEVKPDWMGLIFYEKSPRFVPDSSAEKLKGVPVKKVGVFVNEEIDQILDKVEKFDLKAIQLHGKESPEMVRELSNQTDCELWKVISVKEDVDWGLYKDYVPHINLFLFDTATKAHGGSGQKFDWEILKSYPFEKGYFLSGGLDEESVDEILEFAAQSPHLKGVDLNSKFELSPGLKNIQKLRNFKNHLMNSGANNHKQN